MDSSKREGSAPSPTAKSKSTRGKFSSIGWKKGNWILPPSIQTSPSWMADHSGDTLTSSAGDSPAKISALRESRGESPEAAPGYGENTPESLAKLDPKTSSWRTSQGSLFSGWVEYSEIWPQAGTMRNGVVYQRQRWVPLTSVIESGSLGNWPTPTSRDWKDTGENTNYEKVSKKSKLAGRVKVWPTPQASDCRDRGNMSLPSIQRRVEKGKQLNLGMVVSDQSGALNPTWVEWLMGYPLGWTSLKD